jgi:hypothetical protein
LSNQYNSTVENYFVEYLQQHFMIRILHQEMNIENSFEVIIKDRMSECTCKTNLSPQLMFRQSYTGITNKSFIGNWTKDGFWISKFRIQMLEIRPDVIVRFRFLSAISSTKLKIRYSIGISSILQFIFLMLLAAIIIVQLGKDLLIPGLIAFAFFYLIVAGIELNGTQKKINDKILNGIVD